MAGNVLLLGVTGSRAFDLAHEGSDTDYTGIFAAPTREILSLRKVPETVPVRDMLQLPDGDGVLHEAGKAVSILLQCNPSLLELLWLHSWEQVNSWGAGLIDIRDSFLSRHMVKRSYLDFAEAQLRKAKNILWRQQKMDWQGPVVSEARVRKHWRHTARLCISGAHLWRTGEVKVRMDECDKDYIAAAENGGIGAAEATVSALARVITEEPSPLPESASPDPAGRWLLAVREHYWKVEHA